jgi:hypothetical protein
MRSASFQSSAANRGAGILAALAVFVSIAAIGALATPARAQAPATAETPSHFAGRLFAIYKVGGRWWRDSTTTRGKREDEEYRQQVYKDFYDPSLLALMKRLDKQSARWGDSFLDYDPVCQCQDTGRVYTVASVNARGATLVDVHMLDRRDKEAWTLVLTRGLSGWVIFDVIDSAGGLRGRLSKQVTCLEHARTEDEESHCA